MYLIEINHDWLGHCKEIIAFYIIEFYHDWLSHCAKVFVHTDGIRVFANK